MQAETAKGELQELVVKLRGSVIGAGGGLIREWVASKLASALGLSCPQPWLVEINEEFAESVADAEVRTRLRQNLGLNFGTVALAGGWHALPFKDELPPKLFEAAVSVFAFDALISNDDRHVEKANYLVKGATLMVIDHERAFPACSAARPRPWESGGLALMTRHVFFEALRGELPDFAEIEARFSKLTAANFQDWIASTPELWNTGSVRAEIEGYLVALSTNFATVLHSAKQLLR